MRNRRCLSMAKLTLRIWILIIVLFLAFLTISPWKSLESGVLIKSVEKNSTAFNEGLQQGKTIKKINNQEIKNTQDYTNAVSNLFLTQENYTKVIIQTSKQEFILFTNSLDLTVSEIPKTKIKTGLDLSGGSRALIKPENISLSSSEISDLISVTSERLNVYGLSDITLRPVKDLEGNNYMLIEIAQASPADLKELVGKQGKFEAKIGNETVFIGGKKDITSVCKNDPSCAGIRQCSPSVNGYN